MSEQIELIHALVDGELGGDEKKAALELIRTNEQARREYEWASAVKGCMKTKCRAHQNPEGLAKTLEQIRAIEKTKSTEFAVGKWAWAMCAAVVCFIALAAVVNRISGQTQLQQTNVASLFSGLQVLNGAEQDPAQMMRENFGSAPLRQDIINVREVAYGVVDGRRAMRIRAADREGQLVLVIIQGISGIEGLVEAPRTSYHTGTIKGATAVFWSEKDLGFMLLGARDSRELMSLADGLRGR